VSITKRAWVGTAQLLVVMTVAVFLPAGTLDWWQGWLFLGAFFVPVLGINAYLLRHDPALIERRLRAGPAAETRLTQKIIQGVAALIFLGILVVPALDHRFGWSAAPAWVPIAGDLLVVASLSGIFVVFRENTYTSATVQVAQDQRVISTGPYRIVRHPMYSAALLLFVGTPLALGSFVGLVFFVPILLAIVWRLVDEERLLARELAGYEEYRQTVRFRLVPRVW